MKKLVSINIIFTPKVTASMIERGAVPADFKGVTFSNPIDHSIEHCTLLKVTAPDLNDPAATCIYTYKMRDISRVKAVYK